MLGTALPVRLATTPPPTPPITCPEAQAMLESPAAKPWCRLLDSATSEISVSAGAKQSPAPSEVMISAAEHAAEGCRQRRSRPSPRRRSRARPRRAARRPTRSEIRPASGARIASSAAPAMNPPAISAVAAAELVDPQRHQHLDRAEHHRGNGDEGGRLEDRAADQGRHHFAQALALGRSRLRQPRGGDRERGS